MFFYTKVKRNAHPPVRATSKSAGFDLSTYKSEVLKAGKTRKIPLGISLQFPPGCYGNLKRLFYLS